MKQFTSQTQQIGLLGETIAVGFLESKGFKILERNYTKKIGEIDIIAMKNKKLHFIEVKAIKNNVSHETQFNKKIGVSRETYQKYNPFQNVSYFKMRKMKRTIQWYLAEKHVSRETLIQIDVIAVIINDVKRSARVEMMWNVVA
jgi:putative endonuclease